MKVLILGGTVFVGRHLVEAALDKGHEVTLFNRGKTNQELFPNVEKLQGDREGGLTSLEGRKWDVVIDTTGYVPRIVEQSGRLLKDAVDHYVFISTISVYRDFKEKYLDEKYPPGSLKKETEEINGETYGPLKAACEQKLNEILPEKTLIIRPGIIVGPHDPTDRFTYWVDRFNKGGKAVLPNIPNQELQWIDARDLASWTMKMAEAKETGVYNAAGYEHEVTMANLVEQLQTSSSNPAKPVYVEEKLLLEKGIQPFTDIPLWIPVSEKNPHGYFLVNNRRAIDKGLRFRPMKETIEDTCIWVKATNRIVNKAGLSEAKEKEVLTVLHP
ncbi:NAD-dependent epimerase/dehydratase family protein [Thalassobacillus pellis]|uniref:NAD-dependent epimerase/dehydratase family protein n=1 Tax=Thalassobacillus pellis TaxID=748008 RepID=UPI00195FC58A|nr:2'-hydroxyisoflavone reductase [Thalassobacillus pellis]